MITFEGVTKQYPDGTTAVDRLDLTIEAESFTVFVGPSGCGKTTSMRMINRMITPTSGKIFVDGRDIAQTDAVKLRLGIGYVIQNAGLLPHRTVIDNVATVPVLRGESRRAARKAALGGYSNESVWTSPLPPAIPDNSRVGSNNVWELREHWLPIRRSC